MYFSYDDEIRSKVEQLPEEDRLLLLESMFNAIVATMESYYSAVGVPERDIPKRLKIEIDGVKSLIDNRLKLRTNEKPIPLEADPSVPTDKSFAFDAKFDFQRLMDTVSKPK